MVSSNGCVAVVDGKARCFGRIWFCFEVCLALEPLASKHKVAMCQAKVVGRLIAMNHSGDPSLMDCAGRILKLLA